MTKPTRHLTGQDLLRALDGELPKREARRVEQHVAACWSCRARQREIEASIADFVRTHRQSQQAAIPPGDGPRLRLTARLAEQSAPRVHPGWALRFAGLAFAVVVVLLFWRQPAVVRAVTVDTPDPRLTPGAVIAMLPAEVCALENVNNREVPASLQTQVFEQYGIVGVPPEAYEVDYLITPALGGAEDVRNLWPHSYESTEWNALVKDQLEDYLREEVCSGRMDIATSQREIAENWIEAYKRHFRTDTPLKEIPR